MKCYKTLISGTAAIALAAGAAVGCGEADDGPGEGASSAWQGVVRKPGANVRFWFQDFDGDGKADPVYYHPPDNTWHTLPSSGGAETVFAYGNPDDVFVPGQYDGDTKTDFAVYRPSEGNWYVYGSQTGTETVTQWGGAPDDVPVPGDYDGDGLIDRAVFRASEGNWYVLLHSGATMVVGWGVATDRVVPGDYDGDGKTDFAVYRPTEGNWYVILSKTGAMTFPMAQWGQPGDSPVPADYDGDGKTDPAIYRPSTNEWWITASSTGAYTVTKFGDMPRYGSTHDRLVPADYDGDRKADLAVFHADSGTWQIHFSLGAPTSSRPTEPWTTSSQTIAIRPAAAARTTWGG